MSAGGFGWWCLVSVEPKRGRGRWLRGRLARLGIATAGALLVAAVSLWLLDASFPFPFEKLQREPAVLVADSEGAPLRMFLPADQIWRLPVRLDELPPEVPQALVSVEDRRFYRHPGVDPLAVARAVVANLRAGRVVSGASTISMQIARMVEPKPRTLGAKLVETFRALQLERALSKREVLEAYLNLAPYGGNVEGVGAAAWFYFGKSPGSLSLGEVALLTALPRAPTYYDPARSREAAAEGRGFVLRRLLERGAVTEDAVAHAERQPLPEGRREPPFEAPHLARLVKDRFASPGGPSLASTLDRRVQRVAERSLERRVAELRRDGIGNAAIVVIEIESRAVRALVGSADFFDRERQGQVNGAVARRSPGSTLKPFLYAMAIDDGRVVPASFLLDIPTDFSGYVAENYDQRYRGRVTVRRALAESLNAPAVRLLSAVGVGPFIDLLRRGGLSTIDRPSGSYGLPLVLGAAEVSLLELTNLYAALAEGGVYRGVRLLEPDGGSGSVRLVSPETARLVTEMLLDVERADLPASWSLTRAVPEVAWKTGTSYGHRDAWAIGFSGRYAIGVWVGNFDGGPARGISGSRHAGPLLFDLFRSLEPPGTSRLQRSPRLEISTVEACALSRERASRHCPEKVRIEVLPRQTRLRECRQHKPVFVDRRTDALLAGDCLKRRPYRATVVEVHPPELVAWWRSEGRALPSLPVVDPSCGLPTGDPPRIVSPDGSTPYRLRTGAPADYQRVALVARSSPHPVSSSARLFWYQDGRLVASGDSGERLFLPLAPGSHRLVVVDGAGRSDAISYLVE